MLASVVTLFERLNADELHYCHWKSNWLLQESLSGATDIDLLVERGDATAFRAILQELGFRPAIESGVDRAPSVEHYHLLDEPSRALIHVHAYYRVISGESLAKNYRLPLEEMLLQNAERIGIVNVPSKGAELVVFVLRMCLKHTTFAELALLSRDWVSVRREVAWLATEDAPGQAKKLLAVWLPGFDGRLFEKALDALLAPAPLRRRILIGRRVRAQLQPYARHGRARAWLAGNRGLVERSVYRLRGSRKGLVPVAGGAVVAFVGAEAVGKSTMLEDADRWLGAHYTVQRAHAGKPPSTALTAIPNLLLPTVRRLLPGQRSTEVRARRASERGDVETKASFPMLFGIRSVFLAYDRRALLTRAFARSANGVIVLCDRYPSGPTGAPDGPQLGGNHPLLIEGRLRRWLTYLEARLYRDIPPPDLVIHLTAPLEVALQRNRSRVKTEPEDYVLTRYASSSKLQFDGTQVIKVDTNRPPRDSAFEIREAIWEIL